jgi:hypothetical protein
VIPLEEVVDDVVARSTREARLGVVAALGQVVPHVGTDQLGRYGVWGAVWEPARLRERDYPIGASSGRIEHRGDMESERCVGQPLDLRVLIHAVVDVEVGH